LIQVGDFYIYFVSQEIFFVIFKQWRLQPNIAKLGAMTKCHDNPPFSLEERNTFCIFFPTLVILIRKLQNGFLVLHESELW